MNKITVWTEIIISAEDAAREALANFFFEHESCGVEEIGNLIKGYFAGSLVSGDLRSYLNIYLESLRDLGFSVGTPEFNTIPAQDWNSQWRKNFKPIKVTSRIIVKPPWEKCNCSGNQVVVDIMPRMAFGTGTHETTQLCLALLEIYMKPGEAVLDIGTGSGILAITAAKLGACCVLAVDTDEHAVENARENVVQNGVEGRVEVLKGTVDSIVSRTFDLILANINRNILTTLLPKLKRLCQKK
ncbi:50S ribosomal protein L11 methyltransferase, partial [bacterium]|nr:50S ribosomal protein L11 methyltransferase [bacterium]